INFRGNIDKSIGAEVCDEGNSPRRCPLLQMTCSLGTEGMITYDQDWPLRRVHSCIQRGDSSFRSGSPLANCDTAGHTSIWHWWHRLPEDVFRYANDYWAWAPLGSEADSVINCETRVPRLVEHH